MVVETLREILSEILKIPVHIWNVATSDYSNSVLRLYLWGTILWLNTSNINFFST